MNKLDRTNVSTPPCLTNYHHGQDKWENVSGEDKQQIRDQLMQMQGRRYSFSRDRKIQIGSQ